MRGWSENIAISVRIAILSVIPMLALLGVGVSDLVEKRGTAVEAQIVAEVVDLAPIISGLVHELQKERGTSAGFIGSNGAKFVTAIGKRRADTNRALKAYRAALPSVSGPLSFDAFSEPFAKANASLERLISIRGSVDELSISVQDMAGYYTPLIADLLSMVESVATVTDDGRSVRALTAYIAFLQGKERAGIERAMGAAGFGGGKFPPKIYRNFVRLGAMQDAYGSVFDRFASDSQKKVFAEVLASVEQAEVTRMRGIAYNNPFGGDVSEISGSQWFEASTSRIDALKSVEDRIAADIVSSAHALADGAMTKFWILVALMIGLFAITALLSAFLARSIAVPVRALARNMCQLAGNNTEIDIVGLTRKDEIGNMAKAVEVFRENAIARLHLERNAQTERDRERQRQGFIEEIINTFKRAIADTLAAVEGETTTMRGTAMKLSQSAQSASHEASSAEQASSGASANVQTVAAATEELASSIREIASQAHRANSIVTSATEAAVATDHDVSSLSEAAEKVGAVVELIRDIAEQTNLLALNATIEAARAGEMGKGFAVVAAEVKTLATQTSKATDEIADQISGIQVLTRNAVEAIRAITQTVGEINTVTTTIASAVEEQEAATQEIANSIQLASDGTNAAVHNVKGVTGAIAETAQEADTVRSASDSLTVTAERLSTVVEQFLANVAKDVEERRKSIRTKMNEVVIILTSGRRLNTTMIDASETGCQIGPAENVEPGQKVRIELANGHTIDGTVVRRSDKNLGLEFDKPIENINRLRAG